MVQFFEDQFMVGLPSPTEVFNRKKKLREYITEVTNATGVWVDKFPKDVFLDLGSVGVIVTDLNWGWLLPDGVIKDLALSAKEANAKQFLKSRLHPV